MTVLLCARASTHIHSHTPTHTDTHVHTRAFSRVSTRPHMDSRTLCTGDGGSDASDGDGRLCGVCRWPCRVHRQGGKPPSRHAPCRLHGTATYNPVCNGTDARNMQPRLWALQMRKCEKRLRSKKIAHSERADLLLHKRVRSMQLAGRYYCNINTTYNVAQRRLRNLCVAVSSMRQSSHESHASAVVPRAIVPCDRTVR